MIEKSAPVIGRESPSSIYEVSEEGRVARRGTAPELTTLEVPRHSGKRVLVVEDGLIVAEDTRRRLEALGYNVVGVVGTGEGAIHLAGEQHPDVILMDVHLHGTIDGIQAAKVIRKTLDIPVVFVTAYSDDKTLQRAKAAYPFGYVIKPFEPRELRTTIEIALHIHHTGRELRTREAHQRVHSSLACVSSLLSLQSRFLEDESALRCMRESQSRVRAMALIFKHISRPDADGTLPIREFVRDLSAVLKRTLALSPDAVQVDVDVASNGISADKAVHCGLILNELLSVAIGRVCGRQHSGAIRVNLHPNGQGTIHLRVTQEQADPLPGTDESAASANGGEDFSLALVRFLVEELRGSISHIHSPFPGWSVVFPL